MASPRKAFRKWWNRQLPLGFLSEEDAAAHAWNAAIAWKERCDAKEAGVIGHRLHAHTQANQATLNLVLHLSSRIAKLESQQTSTEPTDDVQEL